MAEQLLYVTFGQKYHREPHPRLPGWACDPDGWLEVVADTEDGATALLIEHVGVLAPGSVVVECADIYTEWTSADRGYYPKGCLGTISKDGLKRAEAEHTLRVPENTNREERALKVALDAIDRVQALAEHAMSVVSRGCTCYGNDCTGRCRRGEPMGWDLDPAEVLRALDGDSE